MKRNVKKRRGKGKKAQEGLRGPKRAQYEKED